MTGPKQWDEWTHLETMSQNEYFLLICYVFGNFVTDREILLTLRGFSAFTMIMQESQNEWENAHTHKNTKDQALWVWKKTL